MIGLAIESSCDETSAAVIKDGVISLSNVISTQIDIHKEYGGVVPEIASRYHTKNIAFVVEEAINKANIKFQDLEYIAVTYGPGLVGALLVGVSYAKGLAYSLNIPIIKTNHIEGHIASVYLSNKDIKPPFLALVVSGGHSHIIHVKKYNEFEVIAKTRDDAVGEAFDKVARVVGLGYPGGPKVSEMAKQGKNVYDLPTTKFKDSYDFSFSGIKTKVMNMVNKGDIDIPNMCKSFEENVTDVLINNLISVAKEKNIKDVTICGGVSANTCLREKLKQRCIKNNLNSYIPKFEYCTDNAAMIGSSAYFKYISTEDKKIFDICNNLQLNAKANIKVGDE